jgi:hypothetical protein
MIKLIENWKNEWKIEKIDENLILTWKKNNFEKKFLKINLYNEKKIIFEKNNENLIFITKKK